MRAGCSIANQRDIGSRVDGDMEANDPRTCNAWALVVLSSLAPLTPERYPDVLQRRELENEGRERRIWPTLQAHRGAHTP